MIHVVCATWLREFGGMPQYGIAIITAPGLYDVKHFISDDGVYSDPMVHSYELHFALGAQSFPANIG